MLTGQFIYEGLNVSTCKFILEQSIMPRTHYLAFIWDFHMGFYSLLFFSDIEMSLHLHHIAKTQLYYANRTVHL